MPTVAELPQVAAEIDDPEDDLARDGEPIFEHRLRISVPIYHQMIELGMLGESPSCELIEGVIVAKMPKNPPHVLASVLVNDLFHPQLPLGFFLSFADPITILDRDSEPEPDVKIVRGTPREVARRRITPADCALVIEISDSTYRMDRLSKWVTYAGAGVPIYWIIDLKRGRLEIYSVPKGSGEDAHYAEGRILGPDDEVPLVLDGREVARFFVRDILP